MPLPPQGRHPGGGPGVNPARLMTLDFVVSTPAPAGDERDDFGDEVDAGGGPETFKGWYEPLSNIEASGEDTANTNQQRERWRLYLVAAAAGAITGSSTVTAPDGADYEVDGPPRALAHPVTGAVVYVEAALRRVL